MIARTIATAWHGRYLVDPPASRRPAPMIVGFHGYAEDAEAELDRLRAIVRPAGRHASPEHDTRSDGDDWLIVSVQALNRFYRSRSQDVVAGWMTTQDRELAIADNCAYVRGVVDAVEREWPTTPMLVFSGFSQGVSMAFRAAVTSTRPVHAVLAGGGDVPPEISPADLRRVGAALVGRGARDDWYAPATLQADVARLRDAHVPVTVVEFDGGHEWGAAMVAAARELLEARR